VGSTSLLRQRVVPILAVAALAVTPVAHGSPDPPPGSKALRPDPVPAATPSSTPHSVPAHAVPVPKSTPRIVVNRPAVSQIVTTRARVVTPPKPRPAAKPSPPKHAAANKRRSPPSFVLPPIPVPHIVSTPLENRPSPLLAAFALALAALAAGSGARLVRVWSNR
jgi:hypothetical protein